MSSQVYDVLLLVTTTLPRYNSCVDLVETERRRTYESIVGV